MINIKARIVKGLMGKTLGLIGRKEPEALLLKTRFGIHTFSLKFPIDVLILDKEYSVKYIREDLLPNKIYFWNPIYNLVLELPSGFIKKNKIKVNDLLFLDFN